MVYTGRGDRGKTDLASGERVSKDSERIDAYGTVDELNSIVGIAAAKSERKRGELEDIQNDLHVLQAELANREPEQKVEASDVERLEDICDRYQDECPPLRDFVLAGGAETASFLHLARSVSRRAERKIVALDHKEGVREEVLTYINRLSDAFFMMARHENAEEGVEEKNPEY
ncbi:MAG: cob(I)yrinic acid a,c-diamide adenosyltransferase [Candidatus Nanohaloarchaea archaeon]